MLGRITKADVTKKIVITYARAKSLMDAVNYYAPRYEERDRLSRGTGPEPTQAQRLEAVEKDLPGLLEEIEKYLESEGVEAEKV